MHTTPGPQPNPWPATRWTLIDLMADSRDEGPSAREIGDYLSDYLVPLQAYLVHRRGLSAHDAEDVLQEFILQRFLSRDLANHVDQARGRFRTFLLTALDNFVHNHRRYQQAQKRSPTNGVKSVEDADRPASGGPPQPSEVFEIEWARLLIRQAIGLVKEHCDRTGRPEVWHVFEARVIAPILEHTDPPSNASLAGQLGMSSAQQVANAVVTAKRIYKRALYGVIVKYARNNDEVEAELADLRAILARQSR